jgi:phosphoserine phosphatase
MTEVAMKSGRTSEAYRQRGSQHRQTDAVSGLPVSVPLVLDLDGTLISGDLLYKSFLSILRRNPLIVLLCARWLLQGRAVLKHQLALRNRIDWDRLRLHDEVLALAIREKATGRKIVLATAADAVLARQLASRLNLFDQVFASDGGRNLKGPAKAALLQKNFPAGFIYAGDSAADLAVWTHASGIVVVNARKSVAAAARALGRPMLELSAGLAPWPILADRPDAVANELQ